MEKRCTWLFVSGNRPFTMGEAMGSKSDVVIYDLEDVKIGIRGGVDALC